MLSVSLLTLCAQHSMSCDCFVITKLPKILNLVKS